jgi:hypothetical protein
MRAHHHSPVLISCFLSFWGPLFGSVAPAKDSQEIERSKKRIASLEKRMKALEEELARIGREDGKPPGGAEARPVAGVEKNRPFIQTPDGKYRVEFGGRLQLRYTYQARDPDRDDPEGTDRSFGEIERARLRLEGNLVDPRFLYRIEVDGDGDDGGTVSLTDAFLQYRHENPDRGYEMKAGAGQWKPFFGRQEKQSASLQLLVDRSLANEYFNIDRNIGLWAEGRKELSPEGFLNSLGYELAVTDGIDSVNTPPGDDEFDAFPALVGHLDLDVLGNLGKDALSGGDLKRRPAPGLTLGASFVTDRNDGSGGVDPEYLEFQVYQMAWDFVFKFMGFSLNGEYFGRWLDFRAADVAGGEGGGRGDALYTHGGYLEGGYMITGRLQAVARASAVWNREGPVHGNAVEAGGGLNFFLSGHNLKLSLDVLYLDVPPGLLPQTEKLPGHTIVVDDGDEFAPFSSGSANLEEFRGVMLRAQAQIYF